MSRRPRLPGLAAAVAVVAAACSNGGAPPASSPPAPHAEARLRPCDAAPGAGGVGITVWHSESGRREQVLLDLVARFERAEPTADVTVERVAGGYGVLLERWREAGPAERPSLALMPRQYTRRLADSGQTVAPGPCLREAVPGVLPAVEAGWSVDGTVRAVPFAVSTPVLLYNRRVFAAAGLDPDDPPASLDELRRVSERVVGTGAAAHGLVFDTGPESGAAWFVEQWNAQAGAPSLAPDNGRRRPATAAAWRDGPAVDHLRWLRTMVDDGLALTVGRNSGGIDHLLRAVDAESPAAMTLHTCASLAEVLDVVAAGQLPQLDLGVAPFPGPGTGSLPGGSAWWLPAGQDQDVTAAAWRLATFLASAPAQARWAAATGSVPVDRSAAAREPLRSTWRARPQMQVAHRALAGQGTTDVDLGPMAGPDPEIHELLSSALDDVLSGADPAETLSQAADRADHLLALYAAGVGGVSSRRAPP